MEEHSSNVGTWAGPMNLRVAPLVGQAERSYPVGRVAGEQRGKGLCGLRGSVTANPQASHIHQTDSVTSRLPHQGCAAPLPQHFKSTHTLYASVSRNICFRCPGLQHQHLPGHLSYWSMVRSQCSNHGKGQYSIPKDPLAVFMLRAGLRDMQWFGCVHVSVFSNSILFCRPLYYFRFCFSAHQASLYPS